MTDQDEIRNLLARYCHLIDDGRFEDWAGLFTDTGLFAFPGQPPAHPRAAIGALRHREEARARLGVHTKHHVVNVAVSVDGDTAASECDFLLLRIVDRVPSIYAAGRYRDRFRKVADGWRFAERVASFHKDLAPPGWLNAGGDES